MDITRSRAIAVEFVRELLVQGYTVDQARRESSKAYCRCRDDDHSYLIARGKILVPYTEKDIGHWFSFYALAREVSSGQVPAPIEG